MVFHSLSGELVATLTAPTPSGSPVMCPTIELDFPINVPEVLHPFDQQVAGEEELERNATLRELAELVLAEGKVSSLTRPMALAYCSKTRKLIVHVEHDGGDAAQAIEEMKVPPPERLLAAHDGSLVTGVAVLATGGCGANEQADFTSRYFAPVRPPPPPPPPPLIIVMVMMSTASFHVVSRRYRP